MEYKFVLLTFDPKDEDLDPLSELKELVANGWVPIRETPLNATLGGQCYSVYPAMCLCLFCRDVPKNEKVVDSLPPQPDVSSTKRVGERGDVLPQKDTKN